MNYSKLATLIISSKVNYMYQKFRQEQLKRDNKRSSWQYINSMIQSYWFAGIDIREMLFEALHCPFSTTLDNMVTNLLTWTLDNQMDGHSVNHIHGYVIGGSGNKEVT
jgi:hypothetical protein